MWTDALKPCNSGISTEVLLFSELGHALVHHYRVFQRGAAHVFLRRDYLTRLRVFVSQATAMGQCGQPDDTRPSSPGPASLGSPKTIQQRDSDGESPQKTRRMTGRVCATCVQDISAGVLSPVALSDRDPDAIVYDCRPPVLPVSIRMRGPPGPCVVVSSASSSVAAPPGEVGSAGVSLPDQGAASALASTSFGDPGG